MCSHLIIFMRQGGNLTCACSNVAFLLKQKESISINVLKYLKLTFNFKCFNKAQRNIQAGITGFSFLRNQITSHKCYFGNYLIFTNQPYVN